MKKKTLNHVPRKIDMMTQTRVDALLDQCSRRAPTGARDAALIATLWAAGLRINEALQVTPRDLDLKKRLLTVRHEIAKGDSGGRVALDRASEELLERWLRIRSRILRDELRGESGLDRPIFCGISKATYSAAAQEPRPGNIGKQLHANQVREMLRRRAARAGITERVNSHAFRHGMARHLDQQGFSLALISTQLRHKSPSVTDIYLRSLGVESELDELTKRGDE